MSNVIDSNAKQYRGRNFIVAIHNDHDNGAPWIENDGHGPVSEWTTRAKKPGELVLASDRSSHLFYDYQEAIATAKRDGWDTAPYKTRKNGERAHAAVMADFEYLRGYAAGDWGYVGVTVTMYDDDGNESGIEHSLWGIEDSDSAYIESVAVDLMNECISEAETAERKELATLETAMHATRLHVRAWLAEYRAIRETLGAVTFPQLCETARRNLQREIEELNARRIRARDIRALHAVSAMGV